MLKEKSLRVLQAHHACLAHRSSLLAAINDLIEGLTTLFNDWIMLFIMAGEPANKEGVG